MQQIARPIRAARWRRRLGWALVLLALLVPMIVALTLQSIGVAPRLLGPYLERRASGHHPAIETTGRTLSRMLSWLDRGTLAPRGDYPDWALPVPVATAPPDATRAVSINAAEELAGMLAAAQPGDVLTFAPGTYRFSGRSLSVRQAGRANAPITLRAATPGTVTLEFDLLEGFHVQAPHWVFENLTIDGRCARHSDCEHAFHVVGAAENVVIRNNTVRDFNAHIKINGSGGRFPDNGRIEGNVLVNTTPRATDAPVVPIDVVAASGWRIERNLIADFVKAGGDRTSYGAFAKGGGAGTVFARNVVLCEHRLRGADDGRGRRVGLSLGGGGTDPRACRDGRCTVEHERGVLDSNLIASCSDDGIYINRAAQTELAHNTVLDTAGVSLRFVESAVRMEGNLLDAPLRARDGATVNAIDNRTAGVLATYLRLAASRRLFEGVTALDLRWAGEPPRRASGPAAPDLCGAARPPSPAYGAFESLHRCRGR